MRSPNEVAWFNGLNELPVNVQMTFYDVWGTEQTYNHMSAGWSWMFDTPFAWFKQNASQLGGINQSMAVSWPARIKDKGGLREQFVHVIDVVPTILEATGIRDPYLDLGVHRGHDAKAAIEAALGDGKPPENLSICIGIPVNNWNAYRVEPDPRPQFKVTPVDSAAPADGNGGDDGDGS